MTTLNPIDFDEVWMHPTEFGMMFSEPGYHEVVPTHLRVFITATSREDWFIEEVQMITSIFERGDTRSREVIYTLEGQMKDLAITWLQSAHGDYLQDKVDLNVLPSGERAYTPIRI